MELTNLEVEVLQGAPKLNPAIYLIGEGPYCGFAKIGATSVKKGKRLAGLQGGNPRPLVEMGFVSLGLPNVDWTLSTWPIEKRIQERYVDRRISRNNEWFRFDLDEFGSDPQAWLEEQVEWAWDQVTTPGPTQRTL